MSDTLDLDPYTLQELEYLAAYAADPRCCYAGVRPVADYVALLESGELTASGQLRCSGWSASKRRRCGHHSKVGTIPRPRWSECCAHPGVYGLPRLPLPVWFCEHHSELSA